MEIQPKLTVEELRLIDERCDQFEVRLREVENDQESHVERPIIEDFLEGFAPALVPALLRRLLEVELDFHAATGRTISLAGYRRRFADPDLQQWLDAQVEALDLELEDDDPERRIGTQFGRYQVEALLGQGGMGTVYRVHHSLIECHRALKLLRPNLASHPTAIKRFLVEAQASVDFSHPNIVATYDVDQNEDGTVFLVMELLRGETLDELVERLGPLPHALAVEIIRQVAQGLEHAHQRKAIHRDIKPHNVMWTPDEVAKILDFGLVRMLEEPHDSQPIKEDKEAAFQLLVNQFQSRVTDADALLGTLPYMAPEQIDNSSEANVQSDIYSLGCTLYYLLTGEHAFAGKSTEDIVRRHMKGEFKPLKERRTDVPDSLNDILTRMLANDTQQRFRSAAEVGTALERWLTHKSDFERGRGIDLGNTDAIGQALVEAKIIPSDSWVAALETAEHIRKQRVPARKAARDIMRARKSGDLTSGVLQQLTVMRGTWHGKKEGLTDFQVQHILGGNIDLLRLPEHVLLEKLGDGWKGEVFKARNVDTNSIDVVRTFHPRALEALPIDEAKRIAAFHEQVQKLVQLKHPSIVPLKGSGKFQNRLHGDIVYSVGEFVDRPTLAWQVEQYGRLPTPEWVVKLFTKICAAMNYAHQRRIWHLDLHAAAIKLKQSNLPLLLDMGIARLLTNAPLPVEAPLFAAAAPRMRKAKSRSISRAAATEEGMEATLSAVSETTMLAPPSVGTIQIMPPEQWQNRQDVSAATDIYNLGCTLFFSLTGSYPFSGEHSLEIRRQHLEQDPLELELAQQIPDPIKPIVAKAMAKRIKDRYPSISEMGAALAAVDLGSVKQARDLDTRDASMGDTGAD